MRIGRTLPPAASPLILSDIFAGFEGIVRGQKEVARFTDELREWFNCRHVFPVSSGKAALTLTLQVLKARHPERDHVLIPAFTCYSVPSAIVRAGLKVRLCDVDPATLDFDYTHLKPILSDPRLLCVVPVNLFGLPADVDRIRSMLPASVAVVEDAAQAMGGTSRGRLLGMRGDVGFFSLGRGKALSTVEGGLILTNSDEIGRGLEDECRHLASYGPMPTATLFLYALALWLLSRPSFFWLPKAIPFLRLGETIFDTGFTLRCLSGFQAGLARSWTRRLLELQEGRRRSVQVWRNVLPASWRPEYADDLPLLRFPVMTASPNQARRLWRESERLGLGVAPAYPLPIHQLPELADEFEGQSYPGAAEIAQRLITLPVHPFVRKNDQRRIRELLEPCWGSIAETATTNTEVESLS
ncbi:MAG: DegT/DnrJ/EryC1/StrS family aminotransferase [Desulfuromonadales bacterium]